MTRRHAHTSNHLVIAVGTVTVIACTAGIVTIMGQILGVTS